MIMMMAIMLMMDVMMLMFLRTVIKRNLNSPYDDGRKVGEVLWFFNQLAKPSSKKNDSLVGTSYVW